MSADWTRDRELKAALRDEQERHELALALADLRAAPQRAYDVLRMVYARGFRAAWQVRDELDVPTVPPVSDQD